MKNSFRVPQSQNITRLRPSCEQCLDCMFNPAIAELPQERVAGSQGKKSQRRRIVRFSPRKQSVHDLIRCPITSNGNKFSITAGVGVPHQVCPLARTARFDHIELDSPRSQPIQRLCNELATPPSTRRRIHHGEERARVDHSSTTAARPRALRTSSASSVRLIFMEAVRGKSLLHNTYPPTLLKSGKRRLREMISSFNASVNSWFCSNRRSRTSISRPRVFAGQR